MCFKITDADDPSATPIGFEFCYEMQEINDAYMRIVLPQTGQIFTSFRLPINTASCPAATSK